MGMIGYYSDLLRMGNMSLLLESKIFLTIIPYTEGSLKPMIEWFLQSSAMIMTSMVVLLIAATAWFIFFNKVLSIEQAEAVILLKK